MLLSKAASVVYGVFRVATVALAIMLLLGPFVVSPLIFAQSNQEAISRYEVDQLERRIGALETLALDRRLAVLETKFEEQAIWSKVSSTGVGALIVEALARRRRKTQPEP